MRQTHSPLHPVLRSIVIEATEALAFLDADRLEELVLSCQKLNREFSPHHESLNASATSNLLAQTIPIAHSCPQFQSPQIQSAGCASGFASPEMAVFSRLLALTRENLAVLTRVSNQQNTQLEYSDLKYSDQNIGIQRPRLEVKDGDNK